ncbi:MAG: AraC family transcriptional regulator [Planctomycetota bacterium]
MERSEDFDPVRFVDWTEHQSTEIEISKGRSVDFIRNEQEMCVDGQPNDDLMLVMISSGSISDVHSDFGFGKFHQEVANVGDFVVLPPHQLNASAGLGPFGLTAAALHWEKWKTDVSRLAGRSVPDFNVLHSRHYRDNTIRTLLNMGWHGTVHPESEFHSEMIGSAIIFRLLTLSEQLPAHMHDNGGKKKRALESSNLRKALEYLHDHCCAGQVGSLLEVSELCDLSRFQFCRRFAASTGYTPSDYLMRLRVEAARHHLAHGATIVSAAISAGFSDQAHLTRTFSRVYGVSPGEYVKVIRDLRV